MPFGTQFVELYRFYQFMQQRLASFNYVPTFLLLDEEIDLQVVSNEHKTVTA
jgi:hypothetical protein